MSFFTFVAQYYVERLHVYEQLDLTRCSEAQLLNIAEEASALHKFLTDILEEGYTATVDRFVGQTNAMNRLQRFLSTVLPQLGEPSERERFYLFPELIPLPQLTPEAFTGGRTMSYRRTSIILITFRPSRGHRSLFRESSSASAGKPKPRCC